MFGKYFITLAVTRMVMGSSVCTYKRCKTCELIRVGQIPRLFDFRFSVQTRFSSEITLIIRETTESNEPMFMVTKKAVSQPGNACEMMLRNDSQKYRF